MKKFLAGTAAIILVLLFVGCGKTASGDGGGGGGGGSGGGNYTPTIILAKISGVPGSYIPIKSDGAAGDPIIIPASGNIVASSIPVFYTDTTYWYMAKDDDGNVYRQWAGALSSQTQNLLRDSSNYVYWDNWFNTVIDNKVSVGIEHDFLVQGKNGNFAVFFNFQPVDIDNFEAADWHSDGRLFYIDKTDRKIKSIDVATGTVAPYTSSDGFSFNNNNSKIAISPDGTKAAYTRQFGITLESEINNSSWTWLAGKGMTYQPTHVFWLDNDTALMIGKDDDNTGEILRTLTITGSHRILPNSTLTGGTYQNVAYSGTDQKIYYLHPDGLIHYYSLENNTDHIFSNVANIEGFALRK
ncbi:hypothetical protein NO1_1166 [Candidatus Termititenax aidoneus]|uniref:Uncharacterized protein n=1 Tax=Termititenax aidoneus TaxID=2218524 RepID=A0A388TBH3_TERA1|nr:hypothetical protein NO1_1166 [Candidatus Termititenax aidoneus]